jgi:DnaJ-class molecular chaperone
MMAARDENSEATAADHASCRPCRGTGVVISGLGGEQREQPCPWCDGTGTRIPGRDAQEAAAAARMAG